MNNQYRPGGFSILPPVVKNLLIINGLVFLISYVLGDKTGFNMTEKFGLYYFQSEYFRPWQLVTHLFMHGGFFHLFSNMLALWMFGSTLENYWGPKRFLIYYMVTGLGAAALHMFVNYIEISHLQNAASAFLGDPDVNTFENFVFNNVPSVYKPVFTQMLDAWHQAPQDPAYRSNAVSLVRELIIAKMNIPTVGASGAVFGVLLAFGMTFPNSIIYVYFALPIKAKYFVILYGLFELYSGIQNNPTDNIAHFAHLGGMLFGFIMIRYWNRNRFRRY